MSSKYFWITDIETQEELTLEEYLDEPDNFLLSKCLQHYKYTNNLVEENGYAQDNDYENTLVNNTDITYDIVRVNDEQNNEEEVIYDDARLRFLRTRIVSVAENRETNVVEEFLKLHEIVDNIKNNMMGTMINSNSLNSYIINFLQNSFDIIPNKKVSFDVNIWEEHFKPIAYRKKIASNNCLDFEDFVNLLQKNTLNLSSKLLLEGHIQEKRISFDSDIAYQADLEFEFDLDSFILLTTEYPKIHSTVSYNILSSDKKVITNKNHLQNNLHQQKNLEFASFGSCGHFKIQLFFPFLENVEKKNYLTYNEKTEFYENIVYPSLKAAAVCLKKYNFLNIIPNCLASYQTINRNSKGLSVPYMFSIPSEIMLVAFRLMEEIAIHSNNGKYKNFSYMVYFKGLKCPIFEDKCDSEEIIQVKKFLELYPENCYCDIAATVTSKSSTRNATFVSRQSLDYFIKSQLTKNLTYQTTMNYHDLAGVRTEFRKNEHIFFMQVYSTEKSSYFKGNRSCTEINWNDDDIRNNSSKFKNFLLKANTSLSTLKNSKFGTRFEFRLSGPASIYFLENSFNLYIEFLKSFEYFDISLESFIIAKSLKLNIYNYILNVIFKSNNKIHKESPIAVTISFLGILIKGLFSTIDQHSSSLILLNNIDYKYQLQTYNYLFFPIGSINFDNFLFIDFVNVQNLRVITPIYTLESFSEYIYFQCINEIIYLIFRKGKEISENSISRTLTLSSFEFYDIKTFNLNSFDFSIDIVFELFNGSNRPLDSKHYQGWNSLKYIKIFKDFTKNIDEISLQYLFLLIEMKFILYKPILPHFYKSKFLIYLKRNSDNQSSLRIFNHNLLTEYWIVREKHLNHKLVDISEKR